MSKIGLSEEVKAPAPTPPSPPSPAALERGIPPASQTFVVTKTKPSLHQKKVTQPATKGAISLQLNGISVYFT